MTQSNAPTGEAAAYMRNVLTKAATLANDDARLYGEPSGMIAYEFAKANKGGLETIEDFTADKLRVLADAVANTRDFPGVLAQVGKLLLQVSMLQRGNTLPLEETEEEKREPLPSFLRGGTFQTKGKVTHTEEPAKSPLDSDRTGE